MPVKLSMMHVKKFGKLSCENANFPAETIKFVPVKTNFFSVKKTKKKSKKSREKKKGHVKKLENDPKSELEIVFFP